jgi:hypothetical protein
MDPYIEASGNWMSFHATFIALFQEVLNKSLPPHYVAMIDQRTRLVEVSEEDRRLIIPDVAVTRRGHRGRRHDSSTGGVATLEPQEIPLPVFEEERERRIEIHTLPDRELVTVIELLPPTNRSANDFSDYCSKRDALLHQRIHLLEIDLLLQGKRLLLGKPLPAGDYYALLSRADRRPMCEVYAWRLRDPLPTLPVPLKAPDGDVPLDLGRLMTMAYDRGRYRQLLGYDRKLDLPLSEDDLAWARNVVDESPTPR